jgi:hypothetical protein
METWKEGAAVPATDPIAELNAASLESLRQSVSSLFRSKGGVDTVVSHWSKLLEGVQESPQAFYAVVTEAVRKRAIPGARLSTVEWPEGGAGSGKRLYLRVERGGDVIDVCAAPFGNAFFASSWLCGPPPDLLKPIAMVVLGLAVAGYLVSGQMGLVRGAILILDCLFILTVVGLGIIRPLVFPPRPTFYRIDTANMFYTAVHGAVVDAVDQLTTAKGVRALSVDDRKPIMRFMNT